MTVPSDAILESMTADNLAVVVQRDLPAVLLDFIPAQRWFGGKDLRLTGVAVDDLSVMPSGDVWHVIAIVTVNVEGASSMRYLMPLLATPRRPADATPLLEIGARYGEWFLSDALAVPSFLTWLLDEVSTGAIWTTGKGRFAWTVEGELHRYLAAAYTGPSRVGSAEQSNTAVIFGDALFLKLFRRLRPGHNPDEEISRFLSYQTSFRHLPRLMATGDYQTGDASPVGIGIVQTFMPSIGDGWSWLLGNLTSMASLSPGDRSVAAAGLLGTRTGQLHRALASAPDDDVFRAERISRDDAARWTVATTKAVDDVWQALLQHRQRMPRRARTMLEAIEPNLPVLRHRAAGHADLVDHLKIRVHGDYHLGQTLRTVDDDWIILDFEGEPARTIDERRAKTSPLKDVAGMRRSFAYARATAARSREGDRTAEQILGRWEAAAEAAFLAAYRSAVADSPGLVPADDRAFARALAAWELDKSLYEVRYEMSNRPDWLEIPLSTLLELSQGD